ncbi:hypothetical protein HDV06_004050 [Boothiomyces sp. JEL0866]|nr:hypothetical protein HDV06_004050 [Boothiomyces sp. JEL0866]
MSFLRTSCDYNTNLAGCTNRIAMRKIVQMFLFFNILLTGPYFYCLYAKRKRKSTWSPFETLAVLCLSIQLFCTVKLILLQWDTSNFTDYQLRQIVQATIFMEYLLYTAGAACGGLFSEILVKATSSFDMYQTVSIRGKAVNPENAMNVLKLVYGILAVTFTILWMDKGTKTYEAYVLYRRCFYFGAASVCILIIPPVVYYLGSMITAKLNAKYQNKPQELKMAQLRALKLVINWVIWFTNVPIGIYSVGNALLNELYQDNNENLLIACGVTFGWQIIFMFVFALYLLYKVQPKDETGYISTKKRTLQRSSEPNSVSNSVPTGYPKTISTEQKSSLQDATPSSGEKKIRLERKHSITPKMAFNLDSVTEEQ